jgi:hypothetical protein
VAQAAWDRFFGEALARLAEPNPERRRDLAMDKTIRSLGPRPEAPLTAEEREALQVRCDVEEILASNARRPNYGRTTIACLRDFKTAEAGNDDTQALQEELRGSLLMSRARWRKGGAP